MSGSCSPVCASRNKSPSLLQSCCNLINSPWRKCYQSPHLISMFELSNQLVNKCLARKASVCELISESHLTEYRINLWNNFSCVCCRCVTVSSMNVWCLDLLFHTRLNSTHIDFKLTHLNSKTIHSLGSFQLQCSTFPSMSSMFELAAYPLELHVSELS